MFTVVLERRAEKELQTLPVAVRRQITEKMQTILAKNPFPNGKNPRKLKGAEIFRLRVGSYRVLYHIAANQVLVLAIGHRKEIYTRS